jgi:phage FluMu gp28-like protein
VTTGAPAVPLLPYQKRWIEDQSRFKLALKARQTGFSWAQSLECVLDCLRQPNTTWVCLSRGERQSSEFARHAGLHARALGLAFEASEMPFYWKEFKLSELRLDFPNGSRLIALPANPDTARGYPGNVVLDEFAFHGDAREIWRALYPIITRGYKLRVISTPNGQRGKYYELWSRKSKRWSRHRVDIYQAVEQGLALDIEELREGLDDEDGWQQEYCCVFLDESSSWLLAEQVSSAEHPRCLLVPALVISAEHEDEWRPLLGGADPDSVATWAPVFAPLRAVPADRLFLGYDVGRRRDLSVLWADELDGNVHWTRAVVALRKRRFREQRAVIGAAVAHVRRACIDETGMGMQLAEELGEDWGGRVEAVSFGEKVKEDMAVRLKRVYEDRTVRIPQGEPDLCRSLLSVKKTVTSSGNHRFDAERTDRTGHADYFWAQGLALRAGTGTAGPIEVETSDRRWTADLGDGGAMGF